MKNIIIQTIKQGIDLKSQLLSNEAFIGKVELISNVIIECYKNGGKVILCGNGGSASDALHIAGELVGRFKLERNSLPAIALNADVATLTAIANDYGYEFVFSRQVEGFMLEKDVLIGISTSGNSQNILNALKVGNEKGGKTIALLGKDGGEIKNIADFSIVIPSQDTARIQECHIMVGHILCELVELYINNDGVC